VGTVSRTATGSPTVRPRNLSLDGLRGVAVIAVVAYHLAPGRVPGGFLGVDMFFVLSGYLITASLTAELDTTGRTGLARFWRRRARRILPALLAVLVAVTATAGVVGGALETRLRQQVLASLTFSNNWYQAGAPTSYADRYQAPVLQHLWSLAVEEQFYLVWPLLLGLILAATRGRRHLTRLVVVLVLAGASVLAMAVGHLAGVSLNRLYFGTDTHGFALLIGAAGALATARLERRRALLRRSALLAWVVVVLGLLRMPWDAPVTYLGGAALVALATTLVVVHLNDGASVLARALEWSPLGWAGRRSYGIYLWHWPVIVLLLQVAPDVPLTLVAVPLTLGLAALSWRYLESPFQRDGYRATVDRFVRLVRGRRVVELVAGAAAGVLVASAMGAGLLNSRDHSELQQQLDAGEAAIAAHRADLAAHPQAPAPRPDRDPWQAPPPRNGQDVTVIGDSVTVAAAPALYRRMRRIDIEAHVGMQMSELKRKIAVLRRAGRLRPVVVVAHGTNGDIAPRDLSDALAAAGPDHRFVLVTASAPRPWIAPANAKLRRYARDHHNARVADWNALRSQVQDFAADRVHPGPQGGAVLARLVASAVASFYRGV
jgi:peptidoglycan/LPS O-acetylase OafA/YrhL